MQPAHEATAQLATFEPPLAEAVAAVLRREGVPATCQPADHGEVEVVVPASRRAEALSLLADGMEAIRELAHGSDGEDGTAGPGPGGRATSTGWHETSEPEEEGRPIVMERLRRAGFGLAALLVPLLAVTAAGRGLPVGYTLVVFVGGLVALTWWRNRRRARLRETGSAGGTAHEP